MPQTGEPETETPAWRADELAGLHQNLDKPEKVRRMFASIAPAYDLNNRLHSLGMDQRWRAFAVRTADVRPGDRILDVACGTGDLTQAFARRPCARILGLDFTPEMLAVAERKKQHLSPALASKITYIQGDAQDLRDVPDQSQDIVSIAFGIRNVADPDRALREFHRVMAPGGRLVILEFDRPSNPLMRWLSRVYFSTIMPRTASWISRDGSGAYSYLPASVSSFLSREEMLARIEAAGFVNAEAFSISLGNCVCYRARRP